MSAGLKHYPMGVKRDLCGRKPTSQNWPDAFPGRFPTVSAIFAAPTLSSLAPKSPCRSGWVGFPRKLTWWPRPHMPGAFAGTHPIMLRSLSFCQENPSSPPLVVVFVTNAIHLLDYPLAQGTLRGLEEIPQNRHWVKKPANVREG